MITAEELRHKQRMFNDEKVNSQIEHFNNSLNELIEKKSNVKSINFNYAFCNEVKKMIKDKGFNVGVSQHRNEVTSTVSW